MTTGASLDVERDMLTAALVALAEHGISRDVQELLVRGDGRGRVAPGALRKAILSALSSDRRVEEAYERAADRLDKHAALLIDKLGRGSMLDEVTRGIIKILRDHASAIRSLPVGGEGE